MKKFLFTSFLIASFAIHAIATTPCRLPAVAIDTLYMLSGALVVEYELIRPFDHISLGVGSNWVQASKDAKLVVLLSGNTGKSKVSVPVNYQQINYKVNSHEK